jgi:hypothetical protein
MAKRVEFVLVVQYIRIYWYKKHRAAHYAALREAFPKEFVLPKSYFEYDRNYGFPIHIVTAEQTDDGINVTKNNLEFNTYDNLIRLGGVDILISGDLPEILYRYSTQSCGAPIRRDKRYNFLYEKAFDLEESECGRVVHNGRHSDIDTGEWYYQKDIVNICLTQESNIRLFLENPINKYYEQVAILK